ncbi:hypothetical protein RCL_jg26129.t1 [Rhizophagus clarus]|uniref:Uncharacterized protein n=1 Tax=Rhizophagus clarus TaxID=94130 RepID=A0A8H3KVE3_9GLOM|nr:hypothetical protein RCL_jg26129.t1 [Rhizophagus clarus]
MTLKSSKYLFIKHRGEVAPISRQYIKTSALIIVETIPSIYRLYEVFFLHITFRTNLSLTIIPTSIFYKEVDAVNNFHPNTSIMLSYRRVQRYRGHSFFISNES